MPDWSAQVDDVANELATWPGVRIERAPGGAAVVRYEQATLGRLDLERGYAEFPEPDEERDELIEHGEASPAQDAGAVSHAIHGPSDIAEVLELFDRRYRETRGEDPEPQSSQDPDWREPA